MRRALQRVIFLGILISFAMGTSIVRAEEASYTPIAQQIRSELFAAQISLTEKLVDDATAHLASAEAVYKEKLRPTLIRYLPEQAGRLDDSFADLHAALTLPIVILPLTFSAVRSQLWVQVLDAGYRMTMLGLANNDVKMAQAWSLIREYRAATKFTRPGTEATLALRDWSAGKISAADATAAVRTDYLSTYQALMNDALRDLREANDQNNWPVFSEKIGLVVGYFGILAPTYGEQRGSEALDAAKDMFEMLRQLGLKATSDNFNAIYRNIMTALSGFTAVPVNPDEFSERAAQLLRITTMIPIEYQRGVMNGKIINDLEYEEAHTFTKTLQSALQDVKPALTTSDPNRAADLEQLASTLTKQINDLADPAEVNKTASALASGVTKLLPVDWWKVRGQSDIDAIRVILQTVRADAMAGKYEEALAACTGVYVVLEQSLEQKLLAFAPEVALRFDMLLWQGDNGQTGLAVMLGSGSSINDIYRALDQMNAALDEAELALNGKISTGSAVANTTMIVIREGLEAVLILAALLAGLRGPANRRYRLRLLLGAAFAIPFVIVFWFTLAAILRSFSSGGAALQVVVSLLSIVILLLTTNWFFHKFYWTDWLAFFHREKQHLLGFGGIALVSLGFFSVLREGVETALFLQPLTLEVGAEVIWLSLAGGLLVIGLCCVLMFWLGTQLPLKAMLIFTGILLCIVLTIMMGNTVYHMQVAGWLHITPVAMLTLPGWAGKWLGLYPTWQGIIAQAGSTIFVLGSYGLVEGRRYLKRVRRAASPAT